MQARESETIMSELITVMAAKANDRVVLWEVNPDHPTGEVFIAGDGRSVQVAVTPAIQRKLDAGELVRVTVATDDSGEGAEGAPVDDNSLKVTLNDGPPFDGYDALSATVVVERLAGLTDAEKEAVRTYEAAHKARKTVLEALA
jgi:hypothetical protein